MAKDRGLQTAKAVCPLARDAFAHVPGASPLLRHEVPRLVMACAIDLTLLNRRKRVLVRDVQPLVELVHALTRVAACSGECHKKNVKKKDVKAL